MAHQQFAGLAVLVALAFLALAMSGCANPEHAVAAQAPAAVAAIPADGLSAQEFHNAGIGGDALRGRLPG